MVQNCCVVNCSNRQTKDTSFTFHSFPWRDSSRLATWISRVSRKNPDGSDWYPKPSDKVCSAHFVEADFFKGHERSWLKTDAVPSIFPNYPQHKQVHHSRRKSPKKRHPCIPPTQSEPCPPISPSTSTQLDHGYTFSSVEAHLQSTKRKLDLSLEKQQKQAAELKKMKKQVQRRDKKIESLLQDIKKQQLINSEDYDILDQNFDMNTRSLIENEIQHLGRASNNHQYSEDLKSFAVSLHFYSAAAYDYVRKHLHLPHPNTLRKWASTYNVEPGFLADVVAGMKKQLEEDDNMRDIAVMFDSMSLRKQVIYDPKQEKYVGYVNHGHLQIASDDTLATESLTFLAVGLKKFFKVPFGYFVIDKIHASQQAQLVKDGVSLLTDAGFNVEAIICDGSFTNQATATVLGCDFKTSEMVTEIPHPDNPAKPISFLFDACHLLKNVRNCLGDLGSIKTPNGTVKWSYIVELHKLQSTSNLHLCNKLKGIHLDYAKNKMKVALAAQTLSSSVATAIDFLREDLCLPQFENSEATCQFLRFFDSLFDLCNSCNLRAKGFKSPITQCNAQFKFRMMADGIKYIQSLSDASGRPLLIGKRKTGFVGFLVTLKSTQCVAQRLLKSGYKFVLTYRLSQDHLETLFGRIRRKGGWNNNPNVLQFKYALRSLLMKNGVLESAKGNCISQYILPPDNPLLEEEPEETLDFKEHQSSEALFKNILLKPGPYHQHVLHYISGYIERKLVEKLNCPYCISFLSTKDNCETSFKQLTKKRNKGGLYFAHPDVRTVVTKTDQILRGMLTTNKAGPLRSVNEKTILRTILEVVQSCGSSTFKMDHPENIHLETEDLHSVQMIKFICRLFCRTILHHHGKLYTERYVQKDACSVRHRLNKTVLFLHL